MDSKKSGKKNFENALFQALTNHGFLPLRTADEETTDGATEKLLPAELEDPEKFIKKTPKVVSLNPNHRNKNSKTQYAKVAINKSKKGKKR